MDSRMLWIIAAVIIIILAAYNFGKKRGADLQKFAGQRGLVFTARPAENAEEEFAGFALFSENAEMKLSNLISGETEGVYVVICDFRATTGFGQSTSTRSQSVIMLKSSSSRPPDFEMYPKDGLYKVFAGFNNKGVEFPLRKKFSETYVLNSNDEDGVRKYFSDAVISYFENHKGLTVEAKDGRLLYYRSGNTIRPDEARSFLQQGLEIVRLFQ